MTLEAFTEWMQKLTRIEILTAGKLIASIAIILGMAIVRWIILAIVARRWEDIRIRYRWKKTSLYVAFMICAVLVGRRIS